MSEHDPKAGTLEEDPSSSTLPIRNAYSDTLALFVYVSSVYCCDSPQQGNYLFVKGGDTSELFYVKTGGHGCNGENGQFELDISCNGDKLGAVTLNFDSNASIYLVNYSGNLDAELSSSGTLMILTAKTKEATAKAAIA